MAVTPRDISFKHKLIPHKNKVAPHVCAQSADARKSKHTTSRLTPRMHSTTLSNHTCICVSNTSGEASAPHKRSAAHIRKHHMCATSCIAGCACVRFGLVESKTHILHARKSCEVGVHSARSAVERSNNNNNSNIWLWSPPNIAMPCCSRAKLHGNVNMKYRYTIIPEYTYTCDTHARTSCEAGAARAAGASA